MTTDPKYAGHTPGPWHIESGSLSVLVGGDDNVVAEIVFSERVEEGKDQLHANVELITAAPDLARENARLRAALSDLTEWGCTHTSPLDKNSPHDLLIKARAALGKE